MDVSLDMGSNRQKMPIIEERSWVPQWKGDQLEGGYLWPGFESTFRYKAIEFGHDFSDYCNRHSTHFDSMGYTCNPAGKLLYIQFSNNTSHSSLYKPGDCHPGTTTTREALRSTRKLGSKLLDLESQNVRYLMADMYTPPDMCSDWIWCTSGGCCWSRKWSTGLDMWGVRPNDSIRRYRIGPIERRNSLEGSSCRWRFGRSVGCPTCLDMHSNLQKVLLLWNGVGLLLDCRSLLYNWTPKMEGIDCTYNIGKVALPTGQSSSLFGGRNVVDVNVGKVWQQTFIPLTFDAAQSYPAGHAFRGHW